MKGFDEQAEVTKDKARLCSHRLVRGVAGKNEWDWELGSLVALGAGADRRGHAWEGKEEAAGSWGCRQPKKAPLFSLMCQASDYYFIGTKEPGALQ